MAATIVSAAVSLFLVYNVVLGGNKPQKGSSASPLSAKSNTASISTTAPKHETPAETPWWDSDSSDTASQV